MLPEERLTGAAAWTGKALVLARNLDDEDFLATTLRMHGNELRKAGRLRAAVARLEHAAAVSTTTAAHGAALWHCSPEARATPACRTGSRTPLTDSGVD